MSGQPQSKRLKRANTDTCMEKVVREPILRWVDPQDGDLNTITMALRRMCRAANYKKTSVTTIVSGLVNGSFEPMTDDHRTVKSQFLRLGALILTLINLSHAATMYREVLKAPLIADEKTWSRVHCLMLAKCIAVSGAEYAYECLLELNKLFLKYPAQSIKFLVQAAHLYVNGVCADRRNKDRELRYKTPDAIWSWNDRHPLAFDRNICPLLWKVKDELARIFDVNHEEFGTGSCAELQGRLKNGAQAPLREGAPQNTPQYIIWHQLSKSLEAASQMEFSGEFWTALLQIIIIAGVATNVVVARMQFLSKQLKPTADAVTCKNIFSHFALNPEDLGCWRGDAIATAVARIRVFFAGEEMPNCLKTFVDTFDLIKKHFQEKGRTSLMPIAGLGKKCSQPFYDMIKIARQAYEQYELVRTVDLVVAIGRAISVQADDAFSAAETKNWINKHAFTGTTILEKICNLLHALAPLYAGTEIIEDDTVPQLCAKKDEVDRLLKDNTVLEGKVSKLLQAFVKHADRQAVETVENHCRLGEKDMALASFELLSDTYHGLCPKVQNDLSEKINLIGVPVAAANGGLPVYVAGSDDF
ncbi:unnamed protein product [Amoebophrya sp. A25]|nr:unnamed protein product [Amoebophrya sp. A25]|eukprot:GSA25T00007665001.1